MKRLPLLVLVCALSACGDAGETASTATPIDADAVGGSDGSPSELFVTLESPEPGEVLASGAPSLFTARVSATDGVQFPLLVTWGSDVDGELSSGSSTDAEVSFQTSSLSPGPHTITLWANDAAGRAGQASVAVLLDRPPVGETVVSIVPQEPTSADPLEAQILSAATDPDGEEVTYSFSWFADGLPVPNAGPLVPHTTTVRGQTWRVIATPSDGFTQGSSAEDEVVIGNAIPSLESAQILPSIGKTNTPFTCTGQGWSDADGDEESVLVAWRVNGEAVDGQTAPTITGDQYARGDELQCVLTPQDPYDQGVPVESVVVTIVDSPPSVDEAIIDPEVGDKTTTFTCSYAGLEDLDDGDAPDVHILWIVNGVELPGTTSTSYVASDLAKGDTLRCRVVPVTGEVQGSPVDSAEVTIGNAPPIAGAVVMEPVPPTEGTGVTCVAAEADDPDGDNVAYTYGWTVNDEPVDGVDGDHLSGEHYDKGDTIRCSAIPTDGTDEGESADAKFAVVVANTPPSLFSASITPSDGGKADTFSCVPEGWSDDDPADVAEYTYAWKLDGVEVPGGIFETLVPDDVGPGFLTCVVTPGDGESWGDPVESGPSLVINHAPSIDAVTLGPEPATESTTLECAPSGWSDPDGDPESYVVSWTVGGVEVGGQTGLQLTGTHFDKTDIVLCMAVPFDGTDEGQGKASNPVQIGNTLPAVDGVTLAPLAGGKTALFTCEVGAGIDPDPSDEVLFSYAWFVEGALVAGANDATWSPGELADAGDEIHCEVTPYDGSDFGTAVPSGTALITNSAPSVASVEILPVAPTSDDTLTCDADGVFDADGDGIDLAYVWVVNESPLLNEDGETLDASHTEVGDIVRCQISPSDATHEGEGVWSADVTIVAAPVELVAPEVEIIPMNPEAGEPLLCHVDYAGGLGDLEVEYVWKQNGEVVPGQSSEALPGALVEACDVWICEARVTDGPASGPWADAAAFAQALDGGPGGSLWFGAHGYDPPTSDTYVTVNQWLSVEVAATRVDIPAEDLPLTVSHLRALGTLNQTHTLRLYGNAGSLPGAQLTQVSFVGAGPEEMTEVELPSPLVVVDSPVWIGIQGVSDFWSTYGDGDGEATANVAYTCLALPGFGCLTPPSWGGLSALGSPFNGLGDLILDLGTQTAGGGGCP